jgi:hypothetical protein
MGAKEAGPGGVGFRILPLPLLTIARELIVDLSSVCLIVSTPAKLLRRPPPHVPSSTCFFALAKASSLWQFGVSKPPMPQLAAGALVAALLLVAAGVHLLVCRKQLPPPIVLRPLQRPAHSF